MDKKQLGEIKERCEAATPGLWVHWWVGGLDTVTYSGDTNDVLYSIVKFSCKYPGPAWGDAEFIAHAREDVPVLIAEVERLAARNLQLEGLRAELESETTWAKEYHDLAENRLETIEKLEKKIAEYINDLVRSVNIEKKAKGEIEHLIACNAELAEVIDAFMPYIYERGIEGETDWEKLVLRAAALVKKEAGK